MLTRREIAKAALVTIVGFIALRIVRAPQLAQQRSEMCASHLKQIGMAMMSYAQDYGDTYPRPWYGRDAGPSDAQVNYKWMDAILPYMKDKEIFFCPEDSNGQAYVFRDGNHYGSYAMNNAYYLPGDSLTPPGGVRFTTIEEPSNKVLVCDGDGDFQFAWPDVQHAPPLQEGSVLAIGAIRGRHRYYQGRVLALGCDGGCSTALLGFERFSRVTSRGIVYPQLAIETKMADFFGNIQKR